MQSYKYIDIYLPLTSNPFEGSRHTSQQCVCYQYHKDKQATGKAVDTATPWKSVIYMSHVRLGIIDTSIVPLPLADSFLFDVTLLFCSNANITRVSAFFHKQRTLSNKFQAIST